MIKIVFSKKYATRRQLIERERRGQLLRLAAAVVMLLAIFILMLRSCAINRGCVKPKEDAAADRQEIAQENENKDRQRLNVDTYPRLINNDHMLPADYVPPKLTRLMSMPDGSTNMMEFEAATAFEKLYEAMLKDGFAMYPLSGYRSYQEQVSVFNWNVELHVSEGMEVDEARKYTESFVALPGASEHQYGRSIDVTIDGTTNHSFQETQQGKWLIDHAHEYGFVIRYPEDKADITGISYEPWHIRYVGLSHAAYMHEYDLCLEEYVELVLRDCPWAVPDDAL